MAVAAVQEVAELDAVRVVLTQRTEEKVGPLPHGMLGRVHHHERPWGTAEERQGQMVIMQFLSTEMEL